jgi:hypothetical protein
MSSPPPALLLLLVPEFLDESSRWLGNSHFRSLPARDGIRGYSDGFSKGSLRKPERLPDPMEFSSSHVYTLRIVDVQR